MILLIKILEWEEFIHRKFELLTLLFLVKLNLDLYINLNIWFRLTRNLKIYCFLIIQQQQIDVNKIQISKTYQKAMKNSQKNKWIAAIKIKIHDIKRKKIYNLMTWSNKKIKIHSRKWVYLIKVNKNDKILRYKIC